MTAVFSKNKKILFLGGGYHQLPAIKHAINLGLKVYTVDNLPLNPGHKLSSSYSNISTVNFHKVYKFCKRNNIKSIVAYGSDVSAFTASYINKKNNHPDGINYKAVQILTNKNLFRKFLKKNNFNVPRFIETRNKKYILDKKFPLPAVVKPVDSSGSKGVTLIRSFNQFECAKMEAFKQSRSSKIIIEQYIKRKGSQIAGDGFILNGKLVFYSFANENFNNKNKGIVPIAQTFPTNHSKKNIQIVLDELERLFKKLNFNNTALNFDIILDKNSKVYFIDIGPRNGGCGIPEVIKYHNKVDLIDATIKSALGQTVRLKKTKFGYWSTYVIHSNKNGLFKKLTISKNIKKNIYSLNLFIKKKEMVFKLINSNQTLGLAVLKFNNYNDMKKKIFNIESLIRVDLY